MYPKNSASPPRLAIGAVVQISDGAVQTSGCTVRHLPEGGAEGDGGGTVSYSTDGVVCYVPTQAETNYTAFVLIAKKTGCIPASVTVVTTAAAVAGKVQHDIGTGTGQLNIASGKVPATVAEGDGVDAAAIKTTIGVAGAGLTALGDTRIANLNATITSRHAAGAAVAKSPATLDWSADVTNAPTIGTSTLTTGDVLTQSGAALAAYDSNGGVAKQGTLTTLAAVLSGITSLAAWLRGLFRKDTMNATAKSEVNSGGGTFSETTDSAEALSEAVAAIDAIADKLDTAMVIDGAVYQFTANALELGSSGTGLDAAGVRSAIGLATANLDTQLAAIALDTGTTLPAQIAGIAAGSGPTVTQIRQEMDANSTQLTGIKTKTDLITTGTTITVQSPVVTSSNVQLIRGDDYATADGRQLDWTDSGSTWPDLTGATVTLTFRVVGTDASVTASTGTVVNSGTATQTARFELTAVQTALFTIYTRRAYVYDVQAALATSGNIVTLAIGYATVTNDVTR